MDDLKIPEKAIQAFEALTQLQVCIHDFGNYLIPYIRPHRMWHSQAPCRSAKSGINAGLCLQFEVDHLRSIIQQIPDGRTHQCHAGLVEWVVPITENGETLAILFAGQALSNAEWNPDYVARRSSEKIPKNLRTVGAAESQVYLEALRQLAERLKGWIKTQSTGALKMSRSNLIFRYIESEHNQQPSLQSLAENLSLSPSRAAHVVKDNFGQSFSEMVNHARLKTACNLLQHTDHTIQEIADRSGFNDQSNFQKKFKQQFTVSPGQWRKQHTRV